MRLIGFDAGTKRIGIAVSDESLTIATGVGFIENNEGLPAKLEELKEEYGTNHAVVGKPLNMNGTENPKTTFATELVGKLESSGFEVKMWDERLTSVQAERILIKADVKRKKRKKKIDQVAAAIMLQNYLDYLKARK